MSEAKIFKNINLNKKKTTRAINKEKKDNRNETKAGQALHKGDIFLDFNNFQTFVIPNFNNTISIFSLLNRC